MRSSDGFYIDRLDHLRALAVFMVFFWHFVHGGAGTALTPFDFAPPAALFPLSVLEEGHSGVALFMVLSGYLFTVIVGDKAIVYSRFLLNRFLRLFPVLLLVMLPYALRGEVDLGSTLRGFVRNGWAADGSWSVMVELHFYLILPALLAIPRERRVATWGALLLLAIATRSALFLWRGEIQDLAAWSILGRIDQFLCGMILAEATARAAGAGRSALVAAAGFASFLLLYHAFNLLGGERSSGSGSPIWIVLPTLEGLGFAALVHLYRGTRVGVPRPIGRALAAIGQASYATYLLHFVIVVAAVRALAWSGFADQLGFYILAFLSIPLFALCHGVGWLTHVFIERPALALRVSYLRPVAPPALGAARPTVPAS